MKKKLLIVVSFLVILLVWCDNTNITEIDTESWTSNEWLSVETIFNQQIDEAQYIKDLEKLISYKVFSVTENKPYTSEVSIDADFDDKSSLQWWVEFSQKKYSKTNDYETSNIKFDINATKWEEDPEPFEASWELSLLYQEQNLYANVHDFSLFMGEWNANAKMYNLMWGLLENKWVNLEVNDWWIISLDTNSDIKLPYIVWTLKNVLKSEWINENSPNFLNSVADLIDTINSHIDLWISTNGLKLLTKEIEYFELSDEIIQKIFTWTFQWEKSEFSLSFTASKNWLQIHLYDIWEFDEDILQYKSMDSEFMFSIQENRESEYSIVFYSIKAQQKEADFQWKIKYNDKLEIFADFVLEPLQLIAWQKISWKLKWNIVQYDWVDDNKFPKLSEETLLLSDLLSSIWINLY